VTTGGRRAAQRAETSGRILAAAREEFAAHGYDGATIRAIAARAGVDPSLVMQHHGSKAALFTSVIQWGSVGGEDLDEHLRAVLAKRLAGLPPEMDALVRSMLTVPEATAAMREHLDERAASLARALDGDDADLRAALIVSTILGVTVARHFLHLRAFTDADDEDIARVAQQWIATGVDPAERPDGTHPAR
jgi:AcrR family transcriptional regulator